MKSAVIGSTVASIGLALALFTGYLMVGLGAAGGLMMVEPEMTLIPAGSSIVAVLFALAGFRLAKETRVSIRTAIGALAVFPACIALTLSCVQAAVAVGEPLYRENRTEALPVKWKVHSQMPDRAVFQLPGGQPYWLTLKKQDGLVEHLKQTGRDQVTLSVVELVDGRGRITRFFVKEIDGFKLRRQHFGGQYFPGSNLLKSVNGGRLTNG
jgi:hypothetical protein